LNSSENSRLGLILFPVFNIFQVALKRSTYIRE
jgi:hypothetical protein